MLKQNAPARKAVTTGLECLAAVARHHGIHLAVSDLAEFRHNANGELEIPELVNIAKRAGMRAKTLKLDWDALGRLQRALPVIIVMAAGGYMVLSQIDGTSEDARIVLLDPIRSSNEIAIDRVRFEDIWSGEIILLRPAYRFADEEQPFGIRLIAALVFREHRLVRDVAISALMLSLMSLAPIMFWRLLTDKVIYYRGFSTFSTLCVGMLVVILFEAVFAYLRSFLIMVLTARVDIKLSEYVFRKLLALPMDFFERTQVGIVMRDVNEIWKVRSFLTGQLFGSILDSMTLLIFIPVMLVYSPLLTIIVLAICGLIVGWLLAMLPLLRARTSAVVKAEGARGAFLVQTLQGMRTVKSLALEHNLMSKWDAYVAEIARLKMAEGQVSSLVSAVVRPLERLAVSASFALGVYLAITTNDPVMIGGLYAFLMLSMRVSGPLLQMAQLVTQYDEARTAVGLVSRLVNAPKEDALSGSGVRAVASGHVEFADVKFKYKGASAFALDGANFEVQEGTTLGIVGRSGSGKTTVTRLIQRLHTDYAGQIKIGGVDLREYDTRSLRRSLGVVLQENFLFSGTIRDNIVAAKPSATQQEVVRAARLAGAEEFIERLPRGYETYIFEGSPNLSGGQRQRLAIARSLILDPRIMILDEATSALDPESEAIVNANLNRISAGRTMIIVSHRLSSLVNTNATMVLDRGKVLDVGRHHELVERCDVYSGLWHQQNLHTLTAINATAVASTKQREQLRA